MHHRLLETVAAIRARHAEPARLGLVLGSGLGAYADTFDRRTVIPFDELPHFPRSTVLGHSGNLVLGETHGVATAALQGRVHFYEGYSMAEVAYPVRVLGLLGVRQIVITNAAGGVDTSFRPGDLMLISDHINLMGANPLVGPNLEELGVRFPDMSDAYSTELRAIAHRVGRERGIELREGVYAAMAGPAYETPAEIRMLRTLGAAAVGMSTAPEVIAANHMGLGVLGISCITNMAAGILPRKLTHAEVIETTARVQEKFLTLLDHLVPAIAAGEARA